MMLYSFNNECCGKHFCNCHQATIFVGLSFLVGWQAIGAIHTCGDSIIATAAHVAIMSMLPCEGTMSTILPTVTSVDDM
jgi:hypothetical protein